MKEVLAGWAVVDADGRICWLRRRRNSALKLAEWCSTPGRMASVRPLYLGELPEVAP